MKNVKLNIRKIAKAGFSLVEMLVVIAVIGVIAAIAIPQMGNVNESAKQASARRNAQSVASIASAALAAGYSFTGTSASAIYDEVAGGVTPASGSFSGRLFKVPNLPTATTDKGAITSYLTWDDSNKVMNYIGNTVAQ